MNNTIQQFCILLLSFLMLGAGCAKSSDQISGQPESNTKVFCSPDGDLVRKQTNQSRRIYCLQTQKTEPQVDVPLDYSFAIIDDRGEKLKDFEVVHEKLMHVIVIRDDLKEFQHIHPEFNLDTGNFTLKDLNFSTDGSYRMFIDFNPKNQPSDLHGNQRGVTLIENFAVGTGSKNNKPDLRNMDTVKIVGSFKVTLNPMNTLNEIQESVEKSEKLVAAKEMKINFQVEGKDGQPLEHIQKYLGELGHLVIVKADTLEYIHTHPIQSRTNIYNRIPFAVTFPEAGLYKLFLEFKYGKSVYMVDYNVNVVVEENSAQ